MKHKFIAIQVSVVLTLKKHLLIKLFSCYSDIDRQPRNVVESPTPEILKSMWIWHLGMWFNAERGSAGLIVGLN